MEHVRSYASLIFKCLQTSFCYDCRRCIHEGYTVGQVVTLLKKFPNMRWFPVVDVLDSEYIMAGQGQNGYVAKFSVTLLKKATVTSFCCSKLCAETT